PILGDENPSWLGATRLAGDREVALDAARDRVTEPGEVQVLREQRLGGRSGEVHDDRRHARLAEEGEVAAEDLRPAQPRFQGVGDGDGELASHPGLRLLDGPERDGRTGLRTARVVQADRDVRGVDVGELAAPLGLRCLLNRARQQWTSADAPERGRRRLGDAVHHVRLGNPDPGEFSGVGAAVSRIEEDTAPLEASTLLTRYAFAERGLRARSDAPSQPVERREGLVARITVRREADVVLKLAYRIVCLESEDAVLFAGIEAERVESCLQIADVVAAHGRPPQIKSARAERPPGFDELAPRVLFDDAVRTEAAAYLEDLDGGLRLLAEGSAFVCDRVAQRNQARLDVGDGAARVSEPECWSFAGHMRGVGVASLHP